MATICSGCGTLSGFSVVLSSPNSAVFAPSPMASVRMAVAENALFSHRNLIACFRSCTRGIVAGRGPEVLGSALRHAAFGPSLKPNAQAQAIRLMTQVDAHR